MFTGLCNPLSSVAFLVGKVMKLKNLPLASALAQLLEANPLLLAQPGLLVEEIRAEVCADLGTCSCVKLND